MVAKGYFFVKIKSCKCYSNFLPKDNIENSHPGSVSRSVLIASIVMRTLDKQLRHIKAFWRLTRRFRTRVRMVLLKFYLWLIPTESQRVFGLTLIVGAVCGLVAVAFHLSIIAAEDLFIDRAFATEGNYGLFLMIATPALGGVLSGILLYYVVPGARGSGIPQVKVAYEIKGGRLPFREAIGKFFISSLQIGTGAALGREGPTVHICAGVASSLGQAAALSQKNLRRLLPVGVAAGIAAAFNAPIAAVTFTIEEVVGDLDQTVLSGVIVAAAIAAVIERAILGEHPVFTTTQNFGLHFGSSLILYAVLGIAAAFVSLLFTRSLMWLRAWFAKPHWFPAWAMPAVGGIVTGVLAAAALYFMGTSGVTGGGYEVLSQSLTGTMALKVMAALCLMKLTATVFSYASGGAGGLFAPALFIGAMLGGSIGYLDIGIFGHPESEIGAFALVGMGAVFAGIIRAPITSVLIIFEMTGSYGLILPLMLANMTSYVIAKRYDALPIYEALLEQDRVFLPSRSNTGKHELDKLSVGMAMTRKVVTLSSALSVRQALKKISDSEITTFPVVDEDGICLGFVTAARLERNIAEHGPDHPIAGVVGKPTIIYADNSIGRAIVRMNEKKVLKLFVVDRTHHNKLLGILTMSDIIRVEAGVFAEKQGFEDTIVPYSK